MAAGCLLVALEPSLRLGLAETWPLAELSIDGVTYRPVGAEWSGFYDWLRDREGDVIGVRYNATEETRFLLRSAEGLAYAKPGNHDDLSIFFSSHQAFDRAQSADQDFLYDQVFLSGTGDKAVIAFATDDLTELQLHQIQKMAAPLQFDASYATKKRH